MRQIRLRASTISPRSPSTAESTLFFTKTASSEDKAYRKMPRSASTSATRWMAAMKAARRILTFLAWA